MKEMAVKKFTVEEGSTENLWYRIRVFDGCGKLADEFLKPTMQEAKDAFDAAGYRRVLDVMSDRCGGRDFVILTYLDR